MVSSVSDAGAGNDEIEERAAQARARGTRIREDLLAILKRGGPQPATMLYAQIDGDASLSEVSFQLERLAEEGAAAGEPDGPYELA